ATSAPGRAPSRSVTSPRASAPRSPLRARAAPAAASPAAAEEEAEAVAAGPGKELAALLGEGAVLDGSDPVYSRDATETRGIEGRADAVVFPGSAEDVARVLEWCYEHDAPLTPRGGGTGFAGGAVPVEGGVVLALDRMDRVGACEPLLWRAHVEAGVRTGHVHRLARESGLLFPPDPGA